jgi:hypothetical protein
MLIQGDGAPVLQDLGSVKETRALLADLLQRGDAGLADRAAAALYQQLFAPMVSKADDARLIYVALDGMLGLMPIERLMLADGRYWSDVQNLRFLQTGRGLLESEGSTATGEGLLALGGVDFELASSTLLLASIAPAAGHEAEDAGEALQRATSEARGQLKPFAPLNGTAEEIDAITAAYGQLRRDELLTIWRGADATEVALKQVGEGGAAVPEVLHLATHGFFLEGTGDELGRPELDSGVALAGANRAIRGEAASGEDGILYSLEAQRLNLEGTKLVVLSACDTAKGKVDYSEGVVGLVRALQIAGAENVLMTLWPLEDAKARDFMTRFYQIWLAEQDRSPAEALAMTKAHFKKDLSWQPWHWAPYVLIEG